MATRVQTSNATGEHDEDDGDDGGGVGGVGDLASLRYRQADSFDDESSDGAHAHAHGGNGVVLTSISTHDSRSQMYQAVVPPRALAHAHAHGATMSRPATPGGRPASTMAAGGMQTVVYATPPQQPRGSSVGYDAYTNGNGGGGGSPHVRTGGGGVGGGTMSRMKSHITALDVVDVLLFAASVAIIHFGVGGVTVGDRVPVGRGGGGGGGGSNNSGVAGQGNVLFAAVAFWHYTMARTCHGSDKRVFRFFGYWTLAFDAWLAVDGGVSIVRTTDPAAVLRLAVGTAMFIIDLVRVVQSNIPTSYE